MPEVLSPDGVDTLLTTDEAARLAKVSPATIRSWVHRGKLTPTGLDDRGRRQFRLLDVAKVEHSTRSTVRGRAR